MGWRLSGPVLQSGPVTPHLGTELGGSWMMDEATMTETTVYVAAVPLAFRIRPSSCSPFPHFGLHSYVSPYVSVCASSCLFVCCFFALRHCVSCGILA
jgi:hypothetical protein